MPNTRRKCLSCGSDLTRFRKMLARFGAVFRTIIVKIGRFGARSRGWDYTWLPNEIVCSRFAFSLFFFCLCEKHVLPSCSSTSAGALTNFLLSKHKTARQRRLFSSRNFWLMFRNACDKKADENHRYGKMFVNYPIILWETEWRRAPKSFSFRSTIKLEGNRGLRQWHRKVDR